MLVRKIRGVRLFSVLAASALLLGMSSGIANAAPSAAEGNKTYSGYSHDIKVYALGSGVLQSGPVVAAGEGCSDRATLFFQRSGATVSLGGVNLGAVTTTSRGLKAGDVQETRSTFQATGVNIPIATASLTADAITVQSSTFYNTVTGAFSSTSSMTVANLDIKLTPLGPTIVHLDGSVDPNEGITVPGIASVVLHGSTTLGGAAFGAQSNTATAIKIELLAGAVSTRVGEVYSALYGELDQTFMFGEGQGLSVRALDSALNVGPLVTAQLPCYGNGGVTSQVLGVGGLPGQYGTVAAIQSTATGTRSGLTADGTTTSQVAGINLLGGLVTADAVSSIAHVSTTNGASTVSTAGSSTTLVNLSVAGIPIAANTAPNTVIPLAGVGYVVVNAQTNFGAGIEVIPLVVHVNVGSIDIVVARSFALLLGPGQSAAMRLKAEKFLQKEAAKPGSTSTERGFVADPLKKLRLVPKS